MNCEDSKSAVETRGLLELSTKSTNVFVPNATCSSRLYNYLLQVEVLALVSALLFELLMTLYSSVSRRQSCISIAPEFTAFTAGNRLNACCRNLE